MSCVLSQRSSKPPCGMLPQRALLRILPMLPSFGIMCLRYWPLRSQTCQPLRCVWLKGALLLVHCTVFADTQQCSQACKRPCTHTHLHTSDIRMHTHTFTQLTQLTHIHTHMRTHTHTHIHTHTDTHAHLHRKLAVVFFWSCTRHALKRVFGLAI